LTKTLLLLLSACALANAQRFEVSLFGGINRPSENDLGSVDQTEPQDDDVRFIRTQPGYGLRLTWNTRGYYGSDLTYTQTRALLQTIVRGEEATTVYQDWLRIHQASYNFLIYFMPSGERWRPFITGGIHATQYPQPNVAEWPTGNSRNWGFNYGGGLKINLFRHAMARLDVRQYLNGKPYDLSFEDLTRTGGRLKHFEATVGLGITF
jgi:hypothetical protein